MARLPETVVGLQLFRIVRDDLRACEPMRFDGGRGAVECVLNRASVSGRVEVNGEIKDHFADAFDASGDLVETIALDAKSYKALKTKWMRCKVQWIAR